MSKKPGTAKAAAEIRPVFITKSGETTHVLLTFEAYRRIIQGQANIIELLAMPGIEEIEFDPPRFTGTFYRPVDLEDD